MIKNPSEDLSLDLYADADFAGLWASKHPEDPITAKNRTGYIITIGGTLLI